MQKLKEKQYDLVLVPVANNHLDGFQNVLEVAQLIEPKNISLVYPEGQIEPYEDIPAYTYTKPSIQPYSFQQDSVWD